MRFKTTNGDDAYIIEAYLYDGGLRKAFFINGKLKYFNLIVPPEDMIQFVRDLRSAIVCNNKPENVLNKYTGLDWGIA